MDPTTPWTSGYITEVEYTHGYFRELCPCILRLACLAAGIAPPPSSRDFSYLELGFGQGLSLNVHAAAVPGVFWGTDFNPTHVAQARALARAADSHAVLLEDSFSELAVRDDLPEFDMICLHGIWTWISDENGKVILDVIRRKLKVGGLVYVSYNCFPGWAPAGPLRHLMKLHADLAADASGILAKLDGALEFAKQIVDSGALYFRRNPQVGERLNHISKQKRTYLAHEYLCEDWRVMAFSDVAQLMDSAKLTFVASANILDHVDAVNLTHEAQELLKDIQHPLLKQTVRDYFVNQQFRRDIFVKGPRRLTTLDQLEALRAQAFVLLKQPSEIPMTVTGALGDAQLQEDIYRPLFQVLADGGFSAKTLGQMQADSRLLRLQASALALAVLVLVGAGHVWPAQMPSSETRKRCKALNQYLYERARSSQEISFLASPVTGGGIFASRAEQLFLLALQHDRKTPASLAEFAWQLFAQQGHHLIKDGKPLQTAEENLLEMTAGATRFTEKRLSILKAIEIA